MLGFDALELDGDLLAGNDVGACRWGISREHSNVTASHADLDKYHQSFHCQSSDQCGTCCPREGPTETAGQPRSMMMMQSQQVVDSGGACRWRQKHIPWSSFCSQWLMIVSLPNHRLTVDQASMTTGTDCTIELCGAARQCTRKWRMRSCSRE